MINTVFSWCRMAIGCALVMVGMSPCNAADNWEELPLPPAQSLRDLACAVTNGENKSALVIGEDGTLLVVETNGSIIVRGSGTTANLYAADCRVSSCVVSGEDVVLHNKDDGSGWQDLVDTTGSGNIYTPVLGAADRAVFGLPGLTPLAFHYLCDQLYEGPPGMCRMISGGPVMALAEVPGGIRGLTRSGDILEWSTDLATETMIYDHPADNMLEIVKGMIRERRIYALNRLAEGSYDYRTHPGTPEGTWEVHPIPFAMDAISLTVESEWWTKSTGPPQHITVVGSDTGSLARIVSTSNGGASWQREAQDIPASADHPLIDIAIIPNADGGPPLRMAVGNSGTVLVSPMNSTIFADGFESGSNSAWSGTVP